VGIDRYIILVLAEMLDGVGRSRVVFETWHHELLREAMRGDYLGEGPVEDGQTIGFRIFLEQLIGSFNLLPDDFLYILHLGISRDLRI